MNRRTIALPIRFGQEALKRTDALLRTHQYNGVEDLKRFMYVGAGANIPALVEQLKRDTASFLPAVHPAMQEPLSDGDEIVAEAERILRGEWQLFGRDFDVAGSSPQWRVHPRSGVLTELSHFSRLHYFGEHLGGDVKYIWEINRHGEILRLAQAYELTKRADFGTKAIDLIGGWIVDNPPYCGINWVSALEIAFRSIAWCWVWKLTSHHPGWTDDLVGRFLFTLSKAAWYLEHFDSIHHSPNTHLTGEALGLLYIAVTFPVMKGAPQWKKRAIETLTNEVEHQFLADGFHYERCTGYHRYNIEFYLHALAISRSLGEKWGEQFTAPLNMALEASLILLRPDGEWPVFGDDDGGCALHLSTQRRSSMFPLLGLGAALLDREDLAGPPQVDNSIAWWFGKELPKRPDAGDYVGQSSTRSGLQVLPDAGYYVMRDKGEIGPEWYCAVDAGPHGGTSTGHAHTDLGHIELVIGQTPVIVDPGSPVYGTNKPLRDWSRSLAAHSTLTIDNQPLAEPNGPFGWSRIHPAPLVGTLEAADFSGCWLSYLSKGVRHSRMVALIHNHGLVVVDWILGTGRHDLTWNWPVAGLGTTVVIPQHQEVTIADVRLSLLGSTDMSISVGQYVRSRGFGVEFPADMVTGELKEVELPTAVATTFSAVNSKQLELKLEGLTVVIGDPASGMLLRASPGGPGLGDTAVTSTPPSMVRVNY